MPADISKSQARRSLSTPWMMATSIVVGISLGCLFPDGPAPRIFHASDLSILSTLFLRLIKSLIAPLIFGTLVVGIAGHGDNLAGIGRLAIRSLLYFEIVSTLAFVLGLVAGNVLQPGLGVRLVASAASPGLALASTPVTLGGALEHAIPQSIVDAAARNDVVQILVFALIFGAALTRVHAQHRRFILDLCGSLSEVMFKFAGIVVALAPIAVGAAIAATIGRSGVGVLRPLLLLVASLYGALALFVLTVLLPIAVACRVPLRRFIQAVREPWILAFTTASSEAALPLALRNMERFGVPRRIAAFVLPTGYSFNMDGSAIYLTLAALFVAQAAGVTLGLSQQLLMVFTLTLTSKGVAAVPRAALVILAGTLSQFGLPLEGIALILGVDAFMDMGRTSINVVGNCLATVVMARWDGSLSAGAQGMEGHSLTEAKLAHPSQHHIPAVTC